MHFSDFKKHPCDGLVPDSVYIHHTFFDRALQSPLKRMFQQRSQPFCDSQAQGDEPKESNLVFSPGVLSALAGVRTRHTEVAEMGIVRLISAQASLTCVLSSKVSEIHMRCFRTCTSFITKTVVFDRHDDETDVTAFWKNLGVDADALPSVAFANPWFFQQTNSMPTLQHVGSSIICSNGGSLVTRLSAVVVSATPFDPRRQWECGS